MAKKKDDIVRELSKTPPSSPGFPKDMGRHSAGREPGRVGGVDSEQGPEQIRLERAVEG